MSEARKRYMGAAFAHSIAEHLLGPPSPDKPALVDWMLRQWAPLLVPGKVLS